jgi:hypothetical protein
LEDWPRTALAKALRGLDDEAPSGAQLFWPVMRCRIAISGAPSAGRARSPKRCYGHPASVVVADEGRPPRGERSGAAGELKGASPCGGGFAGVEGRKL